MKKYQMVLDLKEYIMIMNVYRNYKYLVMKLHKVIILKYIKKFQKIL